MSTKTATVEKPKAKSPDMEAESLRLFSEADQCLLKAAREGRTTVAKLTPGEFLICKRMGWDKDQTRREVGRREQIVIHQEKAGTPSERDAARKRLVEANERLATESAELRAELARLTNELGGKISKLEAHVKEAEIPIHAHQQAIAKLRREAPEHIRHLSRQVADEVNAEYSTRLNELALQISQARNLQKLDFNMGVNGLSDMLNYINAAGLDDLLMPTAPNKPGHPNPQRRVDPNKWQQHVQEMQAKLPDMQAEYRELEATRGAAVREAEENTLNYYVMT